MPILKHSLLAATAAISLNVTALPARADGGNLLGGVVVGAILYCGITGNCTNGNQQAPRNGDAVALDREQRMMVQEGLAYAGYYDGAIDGAIGPASRKAIVAYQKSMGAPETGYLTASQITDLMRQSQNYRDVPANDDRMFALEFGDTLAQDDVRVLQASLNDQGYDAGTADGLLGNNTRQAIAAYKQDNGYDGPPVATELLLARVTNTELADLSHPNLSSSSVGFSLIGEYETMDQPTELNCETAPMRITANEMWGYESVCHFPTALRGDETEFSANLVCEGEGEVFASMRELSLDGPNLVVRFDQSITYTYRRCDGALEQANLSPLPIEGPLDFQPPSRAIEQWLMASDIRGPIGECMDYTANLTGMASIDRCVHVAPVALDYELDTMVVQFVSSYFCGTAGCNTYVLAYGVQNGENVTEILLNTFTHNVKAIEVDERPGLEFDRDDFFVATSQIETAERSGRSK